MIRPPDAVWLPQERADFEGPALVDTHVWLWFLIGDARAMSAQAVQLLRRCLRGEGLVVSDISFWELGIKAAKGKLSLAPNPTAWLGMAERRPGFSFLRLDREILVASTQLPGELHGDPADRMLIASAMLAQLPLITADRTLLAYAGAEKTFSVCDARPRSAGS